MDFAFDLPVISAACAGCLLIGVGLRRRRSASDWAFVGGMAALIFEAVCYALTARTSPVWYKVLIWQRWRLVSTSLLPGFWLWFSVTYARGNAQEFVRRWRLLLAGAFLVPLALAFARKDQLVFFNVIQAQRVLALGWSGLGLNLILLVASIMVIMNLERTFRTTVGTMRWRIKFMFMGVALLFVVRIYTTSQTLLFHGVNLAWGSLNSGALILASVLMMRSLFRTGPLDLDVYPSHSVIRGSLTILLAGVYLVIVGVAAKVVAFFGGGHVFALESLLVLVALVFFVLLLQSDRVRAWMGRFVSRHFQRPLYDYRMVWRKFTEGAALQVDQAALCRSLVTLTADIFQALSVAIWLVDDQSRTLFLASSTSLTDKRARDLAPSAAQTSRIVEHFQSENGPVDFERASGEWAIDLKQLHPGEFTHGGDRIAVGINARGQILGVILLGDRVSAATFSAQDLDLFKCIADQAAAGLLNGQLAHKLLQAKEIEAFQTMAAFFVHDLKNAASTLSLMLKNMAVHFDDPAFREDALRGVSKSVDHINHVIGRLSMLRSGLQIRPADADLNDLVSSVLAGLDFGPDFTVSKHFGSLPKVPSDREQITKVVTNLVLNAKEATAGRGEIQLSTRAENGWAVLEVGDNGCGMSPDFIARSLFRPFQTTKKNGLGIGMFQSKMIVERHGGRIAVRSEPGAGTTFQVFLPLQPKIG